MFCVLFLTQNVLEDFGRIVHVLNYVIMCKKVMLRAK